MKALLLFHRKGKRRDHMEHSYVKIYHHFVGVFTEEYIEQKISILEKQRI